MHHIADQNRRLESRAHSDNQIICRNKMNPGGVIWIPPPPHPIDFLNSCT